MLRRFTFRRLLLAVLPTVALTAGYALAFAGDDRQPSERPDGERRLQTIPIPPEPEADDDVLGVSAEPEGKLPPAPEDKGPKDDPAADPLDDGDVDVSADPAPPAPDPTADAGAAVRQAVMDTLASVGYPGATVEVSDGGRRVSVEVPRGEACDRDAPAGDRLARRIRTGLPEVETVRVAVRGSGQSLSDYRRSRCERRGGGGGGGGGRVVYSKRGSGTFTTPAFAISGRRWTVAYRNESDFFQAFVIRNGRFQPFVLNSNRRGSGTESFRGPGRFKLKINGADGWSVSVRDGA